MLRAFSFPPAGFGNHLISGIHFPSLFAPIGRYLISSLQSAPHVLSQVSLQSFSPASSSSSTVLSEPICNVQASL